MSPFPARHDPATPSAALGALALLRAAGGVYAGAWALAAAAPPGHPLRAVGAALLAALGPVLLTVGLHGLLTRAGRELRVVPFAGVAVAGTIALVAGHAAGVPPAALALAALAAAAAAAALLSREPPPVPPDHGAGARERALAYLAGAG